MSEKAPTSKAQQTSSLDDLGSDLVPTAEMKLEPLILKGFFEKVFTNWVKINVILMLPRIKAPTNEEAL